MLKDYLLSLANDILNNDNFLESESKEIALIKREKFLNLNSNSKDYFVYDYDNKISFQVNIMRKFFNIDLQNISILEYYNNLKFLDDYNKEMQKNLKR